LFPTLLEAPVNASSLLLFFLSVSVKCGL
jgi:hypothetical protein